MTAFPLNQLGGRFTGPSTLDFGILLPWVTPANGQSVEVRIIHAADQFLQDIPTVGLPLQHSADPDFGDMWTGSIDISQPVQLPQGNRWGRPGTYVYRFVVSDPNRGRIDWVIDPCAREFGVGKQSAVTVGAGNYAWSAGEANWRTPKLNDLVMYEINLAELHVNTAGAIDRLDYLSDLGVNCLSIMPVSNIASEVDWGYLPVSYFGVDERFGGGNQFKHLVDDAHAHGIAVIVDSVYGHASRALFAYQYLYDRLGYYENPFMGPFGKDYFNNQGASIDYNRKVVPPFFLAVNQHWLDEFHVDGFRYDCVPNYWEGPFVGYAKLVYDTHQLVAKRVANGELNRFGSAADLTLIQCAEQLEDPTGVLWNSYSTSTWQNLTLDAAHAVARGEHGAIGRFAATIGLAGFPTQVTMNGQTFAKTAVQYLENHDHSRFMADFGVVQSDEAGNYLFLLADRTRWFKVQPYLIALLTAKGIPLLFQGQELGEDFTLPGNGLGRVSLLRPIDWDYFYDDPGRSLVNMVRKLLMLRKSRPELRSGSHWYFPQTTHQNKGVMIFSRSLNNQTAVIATNFTDSDAQVDFTFPAAGTWHEHLVGGDINAAADESKSLIITSNYGAIWTVN
jgi:1,4-alpha-glucan branching enzyme